MTVETKSVIKIDIVDILLALMSYAATIRFQFDQITQKPTTAV